MNQPNRHIGFGARQKLTTCAREKLTTGEVCDEGACHEPGSSPAGSADGGSIRIRERATASEPAVIPAAKRPGARRPKQTGAQRTPATAQPTESINAIAA